MASDVFALHGTIDIDTSEYSRALDNAAGKTESTAGKIDAKSQIIGQAVYDAMRKAVTALSDFAKECYSAGVEYESAFAKVSTIMDDSQVSSEDMSKAILQLSNDMGIASTEIADTVYNVISATGDTANAVSLAGQASKLATAGFTDTTSALSVLTTAMNAYGIEADNMADISDSLIMVQNLGVTTVSELSASMGKAIASASAYNVDLNNLESAYVSLTKGGINTAESTTYISAMMKELGSSSTDVGKIIKSKTGKSFSQLMDDGKSLGDVLQVLSDSVDGDSNALMNLWSSAEAGKAANAIVSQGLDDFNTNLEKISTSSGATETAYKKMADTMSHKMEKLETLGTNLKSNIFEALEPTISSLADKATEFLSNISPEDITQKLEDLKTTLEILGPIVAGVVTGFVAFKSAMAITATIEAVKNGFTALNTATGLLNTTMLTSPMFWLVAGMTAVIATIVLCCTHWDEIKAKMEEVWAKIKEIFAPLASWFGEIWENITTSAKDMWEKIKGFFSKAWDAIKTVWSVVVGVFAGYWSGIKAVFSVVESVLSGDFQGAWDKITEIWGGIKEWFLGKWEETKAVFSDASALGTQIVDDLKTAISNAWGSVVSMVQGLWNSVKSIFKISAGDVSVSGGDVGTSHAIGSDYIPYDNYRANLHKGEAILTRAEADEWRRGNGAGGKSVTLNVYPQSMSEAEVNYLIGEVNRQLGGALA